ncbi:hypothetical protein GGI25_005405 [Coemansia spiralis]|uniref:Uncharacterized protein n=1 Tax=Coemansia spiralis TaxID=417178 RepID=A0A9W8FYP8_9FUNG|nr:hypothetical protein GGI26_004350 [Coemansia sp. RSA 1358]KAJ2671714.1 hypothetical protein GGI25_005405 [Coemansia spiralis]
MSNVIDTFTFFRKTLSQSAVVFHGDLDKKPEDGESIQPLYHINIKRGSLELLQPTATGMQSVLTGSFDSITRRSATIRSTSGLSAVKSNGILSSGWTFIYLSDKYKWTVSTWNNSWTLKDINDRPLAKFTRFSFKFKKMGKLEVYKELDPVLIAMVMLTCKLVYNTVHASEGDYGAGA